MFDIDTDDLCATSNVFMLKNKTLFTHPIDNHILSGITRDLVIESASSCNISIKEVAFSIKDMLSADELWISSSTREIMPIVKVDNNLINNGNVGTTWECVYDNYQKLKNA